MPHTPLEVAHAMRTTAHWVRTAPESQRCSGALARNAYGDKADPCSDNATSWCAIGYFGRQLGAYSPYNAWQNWGSPNRLDNQWDEAMHTKNGLVRGRHDREDAFELVAWRLEKAASEIEEAIQHMENPHIRPLVCF